MSAVVNVLDAFDFSQDMVLDEEAFAKAAQELFDLGERMKNLREEIDQMLADLKHGFDTPAGRKFMNACEKSLITPMNQQAATLQHISKTLEMCRARYREVFQEYETLQNRINHVG